AGEPLEVAIRLEGEARELEAERRGLGVDAVGAADAERVAELDGPRGQRVAVGARPPDQKAAGGADLQGERRVEDVGGGQAVMDPAPLGTDRLRDDVDER